MNLSTLAVNAQADALARLLDGGSVHLFEGARLVASLPFAERSAGPAEDGVLTWRVEPDPSALATGSPSVFQAVTKDGEMVLRGSVGQTQADLIVPFPTIVKGARVSIGKFTHKVPR